jgi:hypothetical protein
MPPEPAPDGVATDHARISDVTGADSGCNLGQGLDHARHHTRIAALQPFGTEQSRALRRQLAFASARTK